MRQRARNWCFTFYPHDDVDLQLPDDDASFRYAVFQAETCPDTGSLHYQGYIEFTKAYDLGTVKRLFNSEEIHLEPRRAKASVARAYCMKTDTQYSEPVEFGTFKGDDPIRADLNEARDKILAHTSWNNILQDPDLTHICSKYLRWAEALYRSKPILAPTPDITIRDWEEEVISLLEQDPVKRRTIWIWSAESGTGKTTFYDYVCSKWNVLPGSDYTNTLYSYDGEQIIWFDLSRAQSNDYIPYHSLEKFSNQSILHSTKYQSTKKLVVAHVVVTANVLPDFSKLPESRVYIVHAQ